MILDMEGIEKALSTENELVLKERDEDEVFIIRLKQYIRKIEVFFWSCVYHYSHEDQVTLRKMIDDCFDYIYQGGITDERPLLLTERLSFCKRALNSLEKKKEV